MTIYDGKDDSTDLQAQICHDLANGVTARVRSSGRYMYVRFKGNQASGTRWTGGDYGTGAARKAGNWFFDAGASIAKKINQTTARKFFESIQ